MADFAERFEYQLWIICRSENDWRLHDWYDSIEDATNQKKLGNLPSDVDAWKVVEVKVVANGRN